MLKEFGFLNIKIKKKIENVTVESKSIMLVGDGMVKVGRFFEDFKEGEEFESPARTVTEADIVNFAGISGDFNPLHVDEQFAKKTKFGRRIAHGVLTFAIMTGLWGRTGFLEGTAEAFYGVDRLRFTRPVFIGDTIKVKVKVVSMEDRGETGLITFHNEVVNQRGEVVMVCDAKILLKKRSTQQ